MIFCTKCGKENKENTKFCVNCGNSLGKTQKENVSNTKNYYFQMILNLVENRKYLLYIPILFIAIFVFLPIKFSGEIESYSNYTIGSSYKSYESAEVFISKDIVSPLFIGIMDMLKGIKFELLNPYFILFLLFFLLILLFISGFFGYTIFYFFKNKNNTFLFDCLSLVLSLFTASFMYIFLKLDNLIKDTINIYTSINGGSIKISIFPFYLIFTLLLLISIFSIYNILKKLKIIKGFKF